MPRRKPTPADIEKRKERSLEWFNFRDEFLFTQQRLAEILGLSRRTIQMVESGKITPHPETLRVFAVLKGKHEAERK